MSGKWKSHSMWLTLVCVFVCIGFLSSPARGVQPFRVSNHGGASQIWWEAENFDERIPDTDDFFALTNADGAFGEDALNTINRVGGPGGRISYTFDISQLGEAGTWYFWGRVINPNNQSDFILVEGHPGDDNIPMSEPFAFSGTNDQRVFERNTGPPFGWSGGSEGHIKELQEGDNTMHIVHRQGNDTVFWDVMMWTDDSSYVPTDDDYLSSTINVPIENPGDFNEDGTIDINDYVILVQNFHTSVERGTNGDITFNGRVDFKDFVKFRETFEAQPAGAAAVPEPSSLFLLAGMLLGGGLWRRQIRRAVTSRSNTTAGTRWFCWALVGLLFVAVSTTRSHAQLTITQEPGTDFLAFEAEDIFSFVGDENEGWGIVGTSDPFVTDSGESVLEVGEASRDTAIFDFPGNDVNDYTTWKLQFVEPGDYSLYILYTMFNVSGDTSYGNEDSIYVSSEFGMNGELEETPADPRGARDGMPSFYGNLPTSGGNFGDGRWEGNFSWWNASADGSDPTAENPDAIYTSDLNVELDFGIAAREHGVAIDKLVFHTNANLTDEELDALPTFDPFTLGIEPGDFNRDGAVDFADFTIMRENFGLRFPVAESFDKGDASRDGRVDLRDFIEFRQIFAGAAGAAAVPEPAGIAWGVLLGVGAFSLRRRRSRKGYDVG